jgi:xylitol oxidase
VLPVVASIEEALAPLHPRPHWGKIFKASPASDYPRFGDFQDLVRRYDPAGVFRNEWLDAVLAEQDF